MAGRHAIARDLTQALLVLALVFLNFAHVPPALAAYDSGLAAYLVPASVLSGDCGVSEDAGIGHAPCHACRLGEGAMLPPLPVLATPGGLAVVLVHAIRPAGSWFPEGLRAGQARAPPRVLIS